MLHKNIILLLFLCFPSLLRAQYKEQVPSLSHPSLQIGASVGATASQVLFMPSVAQSMAQGIRVGLVTTLANSEYTAFSLEIAYSQRGWKESYAKSRGEELAYFRKMSFIDLPLLCHLYYPINKVKMGVKLGPQIGLFLGESITAKGEAFTPKEQVRHALKVVNRFSWGLTGGPSLSYTFGGHSIELDFLVYYGFNDIFSTTVRDPYSKSSELFGLLKLNYLFRLL